MSNLELFFMDVETGIDPARSMSAGTVPASKDWAFFSVRLKDYREKFNWGKKGDNLRMDFGTASDNTIQMRNIRLRVMNDEESRRKKMKRMKLLIKKNMSRESKTIWLKDMIAR